MHMGLGMLDVADKNAACKTICYQLQYPKLQTQYGLTLQQTNDLSLHTCLV